MHLREGWWLWSVLQRLLCCYICQKLTHRPGRTPSTVRKTTIRGILLEYCETRQYTNTRFPYRDAMATSAPEQLQHHLWAEFLRSLDDSHQARQHLRFVFVGDEGGVSGVFLVGW